MLGGGTADGKGRKVLRCRDGQVEIGAVRPLEEGKPIVGELAELRPRKDCPMICDVEVKYRPPASQRAVGRPAMVASDRYRKNWDAIWNQKDETLMN